MELLDVATTVDYPTSVAAAWNLSLERLRILNISALRLLQTCAFFAPEPVSRSMFTNSRFVETDPDLQTVLRNRLKLAEATRDINRFALARIEQSQLRHAAHLILAENDPDAPDEPDKWPTYTELNIHMMAANAIECEAQEVRDLLYNQALFLHHWGDPEGSAKLSRRMYDIWRARLGPDHLETLKIGRWLGFMLWVLGHYDEAAQLNAEILEIYQNTVGEVHGDTIEAIGAVAADNRAKGEFNAALVLSRQNYDNCVRLFGDEDPVTMNAAHNLGVSLRLAGHFGAARKLDEENWGRKVQIYGGDHALTLITEIGLTIDIRECGDYRGAHARHEEIVATYRRLQEPHNPALLRALRHLAVMRRKAGNHTGALVAADEALAGFSSRYRSIDLLSAAASVSTWSGPSTARPCPTSGDVSATSALGEDHPTTLACKANLAHDMFAAGDHEAGSRLRAEAIGAFKTKLGEDHPAVSQLAGDRRADCDIDPMPL